MHDSDQTSNLVSFIKTNTVRSFYVEKFIINVNIMRFRKNDNICNK